MFCLGFVCICGVVLMNGCVFINLSRLFFVIVIVKSCWKMEFVFFLFVVKIKSGISSIFVIILNSLFIMNFVWFWIVFFLLGLLYEICWFFFLNLEMLIELLLSFVKWWVSLLIFFFVMILWLWIWLIFCIMIIICLYILLMLFFIVLCWLNKLVFVIENCLVNW